jgi:hypothetical protein
MASLTTGDTTTASLAIDDSCLALRTAGDSLSASRIIGDWALVSVDSARVDSERIDSAAWSQQGPQSRHRTRKLRKEGEVEKLRKDGGREKVLLLAVCQLLLVLVQEEVRG